jgi:membrane protein DedA with SNARE-associated domain
MMGRMLQWISRTMDAMGYLGVVLLMFLENVFPPIPSELVMPLAGFTAAQGKLTLWGVIIAGTVGAVVGALPLYWLGHAMGKDRLKRWADRHGRWLTLSGDDIDKAMEKFDRYGGGAVFVCRLVPGVRSLISIPAGICGMGLPKFLLYTAVGSAIWTAALAYLGHKLGENYQAVEKYVGPVSYVVLGVIVAWFLTVVIKRRRARGSPHPSPQSTAEPREATEAGPDVRSKPESI